MHAFQGAVLPRIAICPNQYGGDPRSKGTATVGGQISAADFDEAEKEPFGVQALACLLPKRPPECGTPNSVFSAADYAMEWGISPSMLEMR